MKATQTARRQNTAWLQNTTTETNANTTAPVIATGIAMPKLPVSRSTGFLRLTALRLQHRAET
jgi:hypothetical protein